MDNVTRIFFLIDRSGSMAPLRQAVIDGYNNFMEEQKTGDGECYVTMYQFDDKFEVHRINESPSNYEPLSYTSYEPRGGTALLDAIAHAIESAKPTINPTDKVVFIIHTDGAENASTIYKNRFGDVAKMISNYRDELGWQFVYFGAGLDAIGEANKLQIGNSNVTRNTYASYTTSMDFTANKVKALRSLTSNNAQACGAVMSYSAEEKKQMEQS